MRPRKLLFVLIALCAAVSATAEPVMHDTAIGDETRAEQTRVIIFGGTRGVGLDAQVALTFIVFIGAFGSVHLSLRRWAPSANPYLFPLAAILAAVGLTEVYRLDPDLGSVQRWSLLIAAMNLRLSSFSLKPRWSASLSWRLAATIPPSFIASLS